jgi:murein DD-endopeptidase MepM/ murein hydrolase activator NlpD
LLAATLVTSLLPAPADAADSPQQRKREVEQQLSEAQEDLDHSTADLRRATKAFEDAEAALPGARRALARAEQQLAAAQGELAQARGRYAVAEGELAQAQAREAAARAKLAAAEAEVDRAEKRVAAVSARIDDRRDDMGRIAARAYQQGPLADFQSLSLILGSDSVEEFTVRVTYAQSVLGAQGSAVATMQDERAVLANARVHLEALRDRAKRAREQATAAREAADRALAHARAMKEAAEAAAARAAAEQRAAAAAQTQVASLVRTRQGALADAEAARAADAAAYLALERERASLQAQIRELARQAKLRAERERREREQREREQRGRNQGGGGSGGSSGSSGGSGSPLSWPTANPVVTSAYGMRLHPVLKVWKLHDGTDFRAYCGTPIRAARAGTVVWTQGLTGYGNQVLVDHGVVNGVSLMTSYNHLSRFSASPGERVARGEVIGYSGTTGYSTACHLHFMVYVDGSTRNPMSYL